MSKAFKTNYNIHHQVESFFTGSRIEFDQNGENFYCGHGSVINKVCIDDGQVKAQIQTKNEDDHVLRFTLAPDDVLIVIAYHSGLITKYNLVDRTLEREFRSLHSAPISFLKINQSSTLLATGSSDGTVKLWNLKNHYCSHNLKGINGVISCIEFHESPDGNLLFCSAGDDTIHIFETESGERLKKLTTHCSTVTDIKIINRGLEMLSIGRDKIAVLWNICRTDPKSFGTSLRTIPIYESIESIVILESDSLKEILGDSIHSNRTLFLTLGEEGLIKFWDTKTGSKIFTQNEPPLSADRSPGVHCLQLCSRPRHNQICTVTSERDIFFYDLPKLQIVQQLQGQMDEISSACWFANNEYLAVACNSNDLKIMEVSTSKSEHLKGHNDLILCVKAVPSDPFCILSSSKDCTVIIWRFDPRSMNSTVVYRATGHTHAIYAMAVLSGDRVFFSGGEDTTLKRWKFSESKRGKLGQIADSTGTTPNSLIAEQTIKAHESRIDDIAISPNDQLVATGSRDKSAKIFSTSNLQILATLKGHRRGINSIQFSPVDQVLVTAGDFTLKMWNLNDFTCVKTFQGHDCAVLNFDFLSSGLQILSIASDGNMKLWDCKTSQSIKTIDAHSGTAWTLSLTQDDNLVVTGGQDGKLIIWRDTTKEEHEQRINSLQSQVVQEQDFMNFINKKKWRKALKMALKMESQAKTLNVMREILLEPDGDQELEKILVKCSLDKLNFIVECCVGWNASAKNSSISQQVFNIILRKLSNEELLKMPSLASALEPLRTLTEKSFNRYERLVEQAAFVDFFFNSFRIH